MIDQALETIYRLALEQKEEIRNFSNQLEAISIHMNSQLDDMNKRFDALDAAILDIPNK